MNPAPASFVTSRLILRRPILADAPAIFEYAGDPEVTRYMVWDTHTNLQDAVEFLAECAARWETGEEFCWVITIKPEDRAIGTIACRIDPPRADFGYVLHPNFWGKGYATEATGAVVSWLLNLPEICRVWATCDTENLASARVLEKAGLQCEGTLHGAMVRPNLSAEPRDSFIFASVRNTGWKKKKDPPKEAWSFERFSALFSQMEEPNLRVPKLAAGL